MTTSTASSTWLRPPQAQWGDLCLGSVAVRAAHPAMCSLQQRSARTENLRAEINCRRLGEDARVTMERARERRLNIEGRNLDADLGATAPRSQGHIQTPVAGVGCVALAEHLRAVA